MTERAREAKRAYNKKWRAENSDHVKEYYKQWRADNKDKMREYQAAYWDRKAAAAAGDPVQ